MFGVICEGCGKNKSDDKYRWGHLGVCHACSVNHYRLRKVGFDRAISLCEKCNAVKHHNRSGVCQGCWLDEYLARPEIKEKIKSRLREWRANNKARISLKQLEWQHNNPERTKEIRAKTVRGDKNRFTRARYRAERRELAWEISAEKFKELTLKCCEYCHGPLNPSGSGLDRKDSSKGYTLDNVVPCCHDCNKVKSDVLTHEEMLAAMSSVLALRQRKTLRIVR